MNYPFICHNAAVANGWWEEPKTKAMNYALVISELMEALEAVRKDRYTDREAYEKTQDFSLVKDTFEDELGDAMIRIFDWMGWNSYAWKKAPTVKFKGTLEEDLLEIVQRAIDATKSISEEYVANELLASIELFWQTYGKSKDRDFHIQKKLEFNATRGHKHGKKF